MEKKTLRVLEFDKILRMLSEYARNEDTRRRIEVLMPTSDFDVAERWLRETDFASVLILKHAAPDIAVVSEISGGLKRLEIGAALSMAELLNIAKILRTARVLGKYHPEEESCLRVYFDGLIPVKDMEDRIYSSILSEEEMADHASSELSNIRVKNEK